MSKRDFEFDSTVRRAAWERQRHRCALCGDELTQLIPSDNCHHVVPDQAGDAATLPQETCDFLSSVDNAVVLCDACHRGYAHPDGRTKYGEVPMFGHYRFSHGRRRGGAHAQWLGVVRQHAAVVWPKYVPDIEDFPIDESVSRNLRANLRIVKERRWLELVGG